MSQLYTTLALLEEAGTYPSKYARIAEALGGAEAYGIDTPIPLLRILQAHGYDDALCAFLAVPPEQEQLRDRIARLHVCDCASAMPLRDGRTLWDLLPEESRAAIEVARRFAWGRATADELAAAEAKAWAVAPNSDLLGMDAWLAARAAAWAAGDYALGVLFGASHASWQAAANMGNSLGAEAWRADNLRGWLTRSRRFALTSILQRWRMFIQRVR